MIQTTRIKNLNSKEENLEGRYILYWMQSAQRTNLNHALEYGKELANRNGLPLVVCFGLTDSYPGANLRHYTFMHQGLLVVAENLKKEWIRFCMEHGSPDDVAIKASEEARITVVDDGYTRIQRRWRTRVANEINCPLVQVATNVIIPVSKVSDKQEYAARTIRPRIHRQLFDYSVEIETVRVKEVSLDLELGWDSGIEVEKALLGLDLDSSVKPVSGLIGGEDVALHLLKEFVETKIDHYAEKRNDPSLNYQSNLSPYLHFGQLSPLRAYLAAKPLDGEGPMAFMEELVVRRELAINFVYYNDKYDSFDGIPDWAKKTLKKHESDPREYIYSREELERAETHDEYWNAAQLEMVNTGKMHGYMRMYWAKKILEWSPSPAEAFEIALQLNDRYELDGRDPNGYVGVSWCFGTHDRPWKERPIFGTVRYMVDKGLKRKFDIETYVRNVKNLKLL